MRCDKETLACAAAAFRGGDGSDDSPQFGFLGVPSETAIRAVFVEVDCDSRGGVCLFPGGCDSTPTPAADLWRAGACLGRWHGDFFRSKGMGGFRREPGLEATHHARP